MKTVLRLAKGRFDVVVVPCFEKGPDLSTDEALDDACRETVDLARRRKVFAGKSAEVCIQVRVGAKPDLVALLGLGADATLDLERLRSSFGALSRRLVALGAARSCVRLRGPALAAVCKAHGHEASARALVEGALLGAYSFDLKSGKKKRRKETTLIVDPAGLGTAERAAVARGVRSGAAIAAAVNTARDLGNTPANQLDPASLANRARAIARRSGLRVRVLTRRDLERERMGAFLAVAGGSDRPPRFIVLEHRPSRAAKKTLVLVGKAVTFDSGGLSIKPARGMEDMKFDMAGGAAVIAALEAIAALDVGIHVIGLVPSAENSIGGSAYRPGDIVRSASGRTIEVINTDAEGRLLLADALHYARRYDPDAVIDIATLTGACVVALGAAATGLVASDRALAADILAAADASGERVWELPLLDEYREMVKSPVADLRNSAGRDAGVSTAAAFLAAFIEGVPWAHLDIAGTGWGRQDRGYHARGATGVGVRLLCEVALRLAAPGRPAARRERTGKRRVARARSPGADRRSSRSARRG